MEGNIQEAKQRTKHLIPTVNLQGSQGKSHSRTEVVPHLHENGFPHVLED